MRLSILAAISIVVACGTDRAAFRPTDNVTRSAPGGHAAASYEIRGGPEREPTVRVNVWSRDAFVDNGRTLARIGMEVRNTGDQNVWLDPTTLRLDAYTGTGRPLPTLQLVWTSIPQSRVVVPPGESVGIRLTYALPFEIDPDRIGSMRFRWAVIHDNGERYVQYTDFRRIREYVAAGVGYYDPIWGYYDPFLYGAPYGYHFHHRYPIQRVIIQRRDPPRTVHRDR